MYGTTLDNAFNFVFSFLHKFSDSKLISDQI